MKTINDWTKEELLALPERPWGEESIYDTILLLPTGEEHESGWGFVAIIGTRDVGEKHYQPFEVATMCSDDIEWKLPSASLRMDCALTSGAMHAWFRGRKFKVGHALSSITVELVA